MGREWCRSGGQSSVKRSRGQSSGRKDSPYGCLRAVRQLFDFYPFHFAVHHHRKSLKEKSTLIEDAEATRNSLESAVLECGPLPSLVEEALEEDPNIISVGNGIQIETRRATRKDTRLRVMVPNSRTVELASVSGSSPEPKTPNLVCRLMGLESVPETPSPSSLTPLRKFRKGQADSGTRSLPETPRRSAARRSSDADPRLSLQLYKENIGEEVVARRRGLSRRIIGDESRSPGVYVRQQIARQVKESVVSRRRFGADITNTTRPGGNPGDELSTSTKSKRTNKPCSAFEFLLEEQSPRVRISEPRCKPVMTTFSATRDRTSHPENPLTLLPSAATIFSATKDRTSEKHHCKRCVSNHPNVPIKSSSKHKPHPPKPIRDCEKAREQCSSGRKKQEESNVKPWAKCHVKSDSKCKPNRPPPPPKKKQEEPFVTSWTKSNVKPVRKCKPNRSPPPPKTATQELPRRSSQWPNNSTSQPHKQEAGGYGHQDQSKPSADPTVGGGTESHYIGTILKSAGINRDSHVIPTSNWLSPLFHPLVDPPMFHHLERSFTPPLSVRCNRRLLFDLVEETEEVVLGVEADILESLVRETVGELKWGGGATVSVPEGQ